MLKGNILARCIRQLVIISVLAAALASCKGNDGGSLSRGDLYPNGMETFGSVAEGGECFYVLRNIRVGGSYTLRTQIAPGSTVRMNVYTSETEYKNGAAPFPPDETPGYDLPPNDTIHEVVFTPLTPGDYVVVLSGTAASDGFGTLYFYDLRLMTSAGDYLKTFTTPTSFTSGTVLIGPGSLHVYSGPSITPPGTYSISLFSMFTTSLTTTLSYPQMFVYSDKSLTIRSLLYSVTSTTTEFISAAFSTFPSGTNVYSTTSTTAPSASAVISNVTFTSNGPYILLRGAAQVNYTLTVGP